MTNPTAPGKFAARVQLVLACCSIVANTLCSGGIFIFPLLSPALAYHLRLTQPQLTTIAMAGMVGQYPLAPLVGKISDSYGARTCSFISAILFFLGFGLFSREVAKTPDDISQPPASSVPLLVAFFFVAGLATVFSLFAALFAASKNFPNYPGIASGTTMALFGLSPLLLSLIASNKFTNPDTGLDVTHFLRFLSTFAGAVHLIGAVNLRTPDRPSRPPARPQSEDLEQVNEQSRLLPGGSASSQVQDNGSTLDLLRDPYFWVLTSILIVVMGPCEMVISNMGTIVLSLPPSSPVPYSEVPATDLSTSTQVKILSVANTLSRLLAGPLADYISPVVSYTPTGDAWYSRKHRVSRISFIACTTLLLTATFIWTDVRIRSQDALWVLSVGTGTVYGASITVLPSILSAIWGLPNLGRNFGIISYAPVIGTPLFSYLYAFISAHHAQEDGVCKGVPCWRLTFLLSSGAAFLAFCSSTILWRRWKGRV